MFQHRMKQRFRHGRGPSSWEPRGGRGPGRRFGRPAVDLTDPEVRSLIGDVRNLGRYLFRQGARGAFNDPEKVRQLRGIVARTRTHIETMFGSEDSTTV